MSERNSYFRRDNQNKLFGGGSIKKKFGVLSEPKNPFMDDDIEFRSSTPVSAQAVKSDAEKAEFFNRAKTDFGRPVGKDITSAAASRSMGGYESSIPISAQAVKSDAEKAEFFNRAKTEFGRPVGKDITSAAADRAIGDMRARPASEASRKNMLQNALKRQQKKLERERRRNK
tara:strand:- start:6363 stop:6881 length:519 start_codon:yes stop_codon:yes gene_type:complete